MSFGTVLLVLGTGLLIFLVTLQLLRRGRIPVKFSILWFIVAVILLVVGIFPNFIVLISTRIGLYLCPICWLEYLYFYYLQCA